MTDRATLEALLARVLEGTGPDRELDEEIDLYFLEAGLRAPRFAILFDAPRHTASLDAALTLVPEGWSWHAALRTYLTPFRATGSVWQEGQQSALFNADAATPARALIAACLKARMEALGE